MNTSNARLIDLDAHRPEEPQAEFLVDKLIIQIPCYNEESTLAYTLSQLPTQLDYVRQVEWLIIDDGSTDSTQQIARDAGVHHIVTHTRNRGLARAFESGIEAAIAAGADVIVNTDADNQYNADDIPTLIAPILNDGFEIVIGSRPIDEISHFSYMKKRLQRLGSWFIRKVSNTDIPDAPSGFRAFSRSAAQQINVFSDYTYTLESIIQAGQKNMAITAVDISVNADMRPSRLVRSLPSYIQRSVVTAVRIFITYRPFRFFACIGGTIFLLGMLLGIRFLSFYLAGEGEGHIQSLILTAVLLLIGFQCILIGIVADLISVNRKLLEKIDGRLRKIEHP